MSRKVCIPSIPTRWDAATGSRVPSVDLNPASKYGDLVAMSDGVGNLHEQLAQVAESAETIAVGDLILCVGDVVLTAAAMAKVNARLCAVRLLRWDKQKHAYDAVEVSL